MLCKAITVPDSVVEEWISVGTSRAKEKITQASRRLDFGRWNPTLIVESKELPPKGLRTMINAV